MYLPLKSRSFQAGFPDAKANHPCKLKKQEETL